jgi:hypothetical protein
VAPRNFAAFIQKEKRQAKFLRRSQATFDRDAKRFCRVAIEATIPAASQLKEKKP